MDVAMPTILLTNDDGVYSAGIRAALRALEQVGDVVVVAPAIQRSGFGRSISIFEPLRMSEVVIGEGTSAYAVGGTPADCVILGIFSILKRLPDLVVSGINVGENISTDSAMTSGTIGAAFEAAGYGVPSIAISTQVVEESHKFGDGRGYEGDFEVCASLLRRISARTIEKGFPEGVDVLNINVPHGADEHTGVEITRLARKLFKTDVEERNDPRGRPYYWISGGLIVNGEEGTDSWALYVRRSISITPLSLDMSVSVDKDELLSLLK
ncbi:MAG: 5/3-nucleotidase [Methanosarcinales archaeon]|nr:MAG: 5'-nucleotidase SurE [Euryarchaeota archaeon 55_53]KUK30621.1 MAG: 5'-nucleotidase SurE [Methanosarcinales archeaon 56_1174]MDI3488170.1 5/3-nucleotidase [Methanosarcinales archaeon]MDN5295445.1 5/3-nucleotidase [Methanosarcinales archaeon]